MLLFSQVFNIKRLNIQVLNSKMLINEKQISHMSSFEQYVKHYIYFLHIACLYTKFNKFQSKMSNRKISNVEREDQEEAHIKVYIRLRPPRNNFAKKCLKIIDKGIALNFKDKIHQLYFDGSFDENAAQQTLFQNTCESIVKDVLKGNNCSLFVYGQTGTGKTYTMGTLEAIKREDQGLIPLSLNYILNTLGSTKRESEYSVSLSFMQIYKQDIFDLLNPNDKKLQIRQDIEYGETYVQDLVIVPFSNYQQSIDLINAGLKYRKTGKQLQRMNELSSRSHTILTIYVSQKISTTEYLSSTLNLIDLAGSERNKKSNSANERLDEAKFINTSLSALGNVISSLAENNSEKFIPYRSSKLTRILKNSLTGRSKVGVICTLDTSEDNQNETYSTLLFADRCKEIRFPNQPVISVETFEELEQEKNMRAALERAQKKEKQYLEIIKNYEQGGSRVSRESSRQLELGQVIEGIYKLFGQINSHLKKVLDPQQKSKNSQQAKAEYPKITNTTTTSNIKSNITNAAQQTITHINTLSSLAFGQSKSGVVATGASKMQTEALTSLLLDSMRQNSKLYETILIKEEKDSLEKEIALEEYDQERKDQVISKLKGKKLKSLQTTFEEIWSEGRNTFNPLQSLLDTIRKGDMTSYADSKSGNKQDGAPSNGASNRDFTNPKDFLKMLTKKESQRKHKEMLIDQGEQDDSDNNFDDRDSKERSDSNLGGSGINYFKNSPNRALQTGGKKDKLADSSSKSETNNSEIKKLLDSLIASKSQYEQKRKLYSNSKQ